MSDLPGGEAELSDDSFLFQTNLMGHVGPNEMTDPDEAVKLHRNMTTFNDAPWHKNRGKSSDEVGLLEETEEGV